METRRRSGRAGRIVAVALLAVAAGCGDPRPVAMTRQAASDCSSCHGYPPSTGAHVVHTKLSNGLMSAVPHPAYACLECHKNVATFNDVDHVRRADGTPVPPPAEVRFDDPAALASRTQPGAVRNAPPAYDPAAKTCSNVYCHGAVLRGASADAAVSQPWDAPTSSVHCGSCHSIPPANHPQNFQLQDCTRCHGAAIDAVGIPAASKCVNGEVDLGPGVTDSCTACHGDATAGGVVPGDPRAAPADASHQKHLAGGTLGVAVACGECHPVPAALLAPGHLDGQATIVFGPTASKGGSAPTYDPTTQTCSNVYCHGSFPFSRTPPPPAPSWRQGAAAVACGTCHGLPPPPPAHLVVDVPVQGCGTTTYSGLACHATYTPTTVDPTLHMDARVCPPFCTPAAP